MLKAVVKRVLWAIPVGLGVVTLTFVVARLLGGDPVETFVPPDADEELRQKAREQFGLDKSIPAQYVVFLRDLLRFDLGDSMTTGRPVMSDLWDRLPATFELATLGICLAILIGIPLGVVAAVNRERWPDFTARTVTLFGMSVPQFWLGIVLLWLLFVEARLLPGPVGRLPVGTHEPPRVTGLMLIDTLLAGEPSLWWQAARHLALPVLTVGVAAMGPISRVTRSAMVEALQSDYVRTAIAMGHPARKIYFDYALRNAMLPIITIIGSTVGYAFGGAILVETVFGWPGMGKYALDAVGRSDFPALQGFVLFSALLYVLIYLLVDLLYIRVDPRTRAAV